MTSRQQAREQINSLDLKDLYPFQKAKKSGYVCPICGDGTGSDGTGLVIKQGKRTRCYKSGCFSDKGEDNVGALRIILSHDKGREVTENEVFSMVLGGDWEHVKPDGAVGGSSLQAKKNQQEKPQIRQDEKTREEIKTYCIKCAAELQKSKKALDYLRKERGYTEEIIKRFLFGYDPAQDALIIPYNQRCSYYVRRLFNPADGGKPYRNPSADYIKIPEPLYNESVIDANNNAPVFVVEAPLCAISIKQLYPEASVVALCGTMKNDKLVKLIEDRKAFNSVYILSLDNDPSEIDENGNEKGRSGQRTTDDLSKKMKEKNIKHIVFNLAGECKDPNELLVKDPGELAANIGIALERAEAEAQREKLEYITKNGNKSFTQGFIADVLRNQDIPYISSGFKPLDDLLDGGFYPGLYLLGAESSTGKTTYVLQIADTIASNGGDVIFFSYEMSRESLTAKSISRETFIDVNKKGLKYENAKTSRGISDGSRYKNYNKTEMEVIRRSESNYLKYADRVFIVEASGKDGVDYIKEFVKEHIRITGRKPVVICDYLQLLAACSKDVTDKQAIDITIAGLKEISRDNDIVLIAISSFNRINYDKTSSMGSLKGSGDLEYTGDCIIGLEFNDRKKGETTEELSTKAYNLATKENKPTMIKVKILKQREGARGGHYVTKYYMKYNFFIPEDEAILPEDEGKSQRIDEESGNFIIDTDSIDVPF